jgi:predicted RNA-binding protein Jag
MKSLIEEASSISKAIEKGWIRAGKPRDFSIKIYEEPEKNFFGMTTKSAKIAIVFDEKTITIPAEKTPAQQQAKQEQKRQQPQSPQRQQRVTSQPRERTNTQEAHKPKTEQPRIAELSEEMKESISAWLGDTLRLMDKPHASFALQATDQFVRITFNTPLVEDTNQEKLLFRSLSYLMIASLRNKFKKSLRGLKLVLASA